MQNNWKLEKKSIILKKNLRFIFNFFNSFIMTQFEYQIIRLITKVLNLSMDSELRMSVRYLLNRDNIKSKFTLIVSVIAILMSLLNLYLQL